MEEKLRIAMVAREFISIPPIGYGGSERVIYDLTEELVRLGHEVYLFAKKGSTSSANIIFYPDEMNDITEFVLNNLPEKIDIIHDNTEYLVYENYYNKQRLNGIPTIFTLHYASRFDYEYSETIYPSYFMRDRVFGIHDINNVVYHGIDVNDYRFNDSKEDYLLCMGIVKYFKGVHDAIYLANKLNTKLIIAGPQDSDDPDLIYFNNHIKPMLNDRIQYIGSVEGEDRINLLSNAKALIFPTMIESFGLVSVEAMASGTPVLFLDNCTGHEILMDKFPQCLCQNVDDMYNTIINNQLPTSLEVYGHVKEHFSINNMANNYLKCYKELIKEGCLSQMKRKQTISLCMIAKNEENNIGRCLESVHDLVDEIIIVDTGSTDRTKEICKKYTDKIYDFEWIHDFSAARNYSISFATCDYVMFLDCDDMFKEESRIKLKELKDNMDGSIDLYWFYYDYRHNERGESVYSFLSERLFRNHRGVKWNCIVHEVLQLGELTNNSVKTDIRITHTSNHDNTDTYVNFFKLKESQGHRFNPREKYFYCMELYKHQEYEACNKLLNEIIDDNTGLNAYELYSVYSMSAYIDKYNGHFYMAIEKFLLATAKHQPIPYIYYEIAECYRGLGLYNHAKFYYESILSDIFFKESFANESVYTNFDRDIKEFKVKSLLSLIVIYYNDLKDSFSSEMYNNRLLEIDPNNESGLYNKVFFDSIKE